MRIQHQTFIRMHILILVLLTFCPLTGRSQETGSCAEKLKSAQSLFDKGQVEQVPSLLFECMKSGFTREEYLTAYKLVIQSYLFEEKLEVADSTMMAFLKANPEYELSPTDHSSFVHLFNNFRVKPIMKVSFHFGTSIPFLTAVSDPHKSTASEQGSIKYSSGLTNLYASLEAKYELAKNLEVNLEAGYSQLKFTRTEEFMRIGVTTYTETQKRFELPLSLTYNFKRFGKFTLYGRLGAGPALSIGTTATADFEPSDINGDPNTGPDIDRAASRISTDLFMQGGVGIKLKTRGGFIFTELRSDIGLYNQVIRAGSTSEEQELAWYYHYADDNFHINAVNFTIGYTQIFYKPSKRK
jgi:outer membrane scaffolding protein for murein synthesis (MipA/OmpV family)